MGHELSKQAPEQSSLDLTQDTFTQLRDLIYEHTGIFFQDSKKYLLASRLQPRLRERRCRTYEDYYQLVARDTWRDTEISTLYTLITTNETYFYRDAPQLETFLSTVVPAVIETNNATKQLRLWSAACSTGDEPYTLALMLLEHAPLADWTIDILATDISNAVLDIGRKAVYSPHALRNVPPALLRKHFTKEKEKDRYVLSERVTRCVKFMHLNLYDRPRLKLIRGMDVIFCRNCLIYFDDKAKQQIVQDLAAALRPKGYLVIGFSETLNNVAHTLRPIHATRSVVYQKP